MAKRTSKADETTSKGTSEADETTAKGTSTADDRRCRRGGASRSRGEDGPRAVAADDVADTSLPTTRERGERGLRGPGTVRPRGVVASRRGPGAAAWVVAAVNEAARTALAAEDGRRECLRG